MNVLLGESLSKTVGEKLLFEDITIGLDQGEKMALIAKNGAGKTSLLDILAGLKDPDSGQVVTRTGIRIGYLQQNPFLDGNLSIMDFLYDSADEITQTLKTYSSIMHELQTDPSSDVSDRLEEASSSLDRLNAWDMETRIREVLSLLGIVNFNQKVDELSGGQKKKVALARVLIQPFDLLILDEPTNHLDVEMIEWLESYLNRQKLSILLVTHDRYFLDNVCDGIFELEDGVLYRYKGTYAYYLENKEERKAVVRKEVEKARSFYKKELEWFRRSPSARTSKDKKRSENVFELKSLASRRIEEKSSSLRMEMNRLGRKIIEAFNIHKSFDELKVIHDFSYTFKKGDRIGIVGPNGSGKTTLLEVFSGNLKPDLGKVNHGQTLVIGYYRQEGMIAAEDVRVIDLVKEVAEEISIGKKTVSASLFLQRFGFSSTEQFNHYGKLSGGERRRLHLLMVLLRNPNFLILDEPTNDLDIHTLNLLEEFLEEYEGCLLMVSHDRYFMDKLVDELFIVEGNGVIKGFGGNYSAYKEFKSREERISRMIRKKEEKPVKEEKPKERKGLTWKEEREFEKLEEDIGALEAEKAEMVSKMESGAGTADELQHWSQRISEIMEELDEKEFRWLELSEKASEGK